VTTGEDAVQMLMAGANIVGVGTAVYKRGIEVFDKINIEIKEYMNQMGYANLQQIPKLKKIEN
jgi:dihydroorotate dehydrogenase (NAD+) catalytic subunit